MKHYTYFSRTWTFLPMIGLWFKKSEWQIAYEGTATMLEFWIPFFHIQWYIESTPITEKNEEMINNHYELHKVK